MIFNSVILYLLCCYHFMSFNLETIYYLFIFLCKIKIVASSILSNFNKKSAENTRNLYVTTEILILNFILIQIS